jgi:hypothetical protein
MLNKILKVEITFRQFATFMHLVHLVLFHGHIARPAYASLTSPPVHHLDLQETHCATISMPITQQSPYSLLLPNLPSPPPSLARSSSSSASAFSCKSSAADGKTLSMSWTVPTVASAKFSYKLAPVASSRPSPDLRVGALVGVWIEQRLYRPEMERPREDAVASGHDLDKISSRDLNGGNLVRRQANKICELRGVSRRPRDYYNYLRGIG